MLAKSVQRAKSGATTPRSNVHGVPDIPLKEQIAAVETAARAERYAAEHATYPGQGELLARRAEALAAAADTLRTIAARRSRKRNSQA